MGHFFAAAKSRWRNRDALIEKGVFIVASIVTSADGQIRLALRTCH
jgi:hypothetical protein